MLKQLLIKRDYLLTLIEFFREKEGRY